MKNLLSFLTFPLIIVGLAYAQQLYIGPENGLEPRWATNSDFDGSILFCRGHYSSNRVEANGNGWHTDYPGADHNFLVRLSELTEVRVRFDPDRMPFYVVVKLHDPLLFKCPVLFMEDVGTISLDEDQVKNLRLYLEKGGFIWVDDFWGNEAWDQWSYEIRRVLPSGAYPMIDIPNDHPILHQLYDVPNGIPQMATVGIWEDGGTTSERGVESEKVNFRGILDDEGRIIVVMTHNTDIADGWEDRMDRNATTSFEYSQKYSALAYAIGTNIFLYALTH